MLAQLSLVCDEFHEGSGPVVLHGPRPSEWPTWAAMADESEVQSAHVNPVNSVPSALDPVRMSCWFGPGEPAIGR